MTRKFCILLTMAAAAALPLLAGCETDDSTPTRPRTAGPFTADPKNQENAEKRALEKPARDLPTGGGAEFPGRSSAAPANNDEVLTLEAAPSGAMAASPEITPTFSPPQVEGAGANNAALMNLQPEPAHGFIIPKGWKMFGNSYGPTTVYNKDLYPGAIPHLPENPGIVPMTGSTRAPGGDWDIDFSWGQGLLLTNYPHRPWPETTAHYIEGETKHNPLYYFNIQDHLNVKQNDGSVLGDWTSTAYEVPWFYFNTLALPVLMVLEPPLAQRTSRYASADPNFRGYLPDGPTVPVPTPGTLTWEYPFLNPDGTVKEPREITVPQATMPATSLPAVETPATTTTSPAGGGGGN